MSGVKPLSPDDVGTAFLEYLPDEVIQCINRVIVKNLSEDVSSFTAEDVVKEIISQTGWPRNQIFDKNYLNFESIYEDVGWDVATDKPGFNETYSTQYVFTRTRGKRRKER